MVALTSNLDSDHHNKIRTRKASKLETIFNHIHLSCYCPYRRCFRPRIYYLQSSSDSMRRPTETISKALSQLNELLYVISSSQVISECKYNVGIGRNEVQSSPKYFTFVDLTFVQLEVTDNCMDRIYMPTFSSSEDKF